MRWTGKEIQPTQREKKQTEELEETKKIRKLLRTPWLLIVVGSIVLGIGLIVRPYSQVAFWSFSGLAAACAVVAVWRNQ